MSSTLSPERWERVQRIFHRALEFPESERDDFVASECDNDPSLRTEVLSLLSAHAAGGLVDEPPEETSSQVQPYFDRVGPYRVIERLGQGGMGTVFLAERKGQGFTQRVALKLLREGDLAHPAVAKRLKSEQRILARLEHPGIARFIDGGTTAHGQPYVAMEYVEGTDLLQYCKNERTTITERLRLFLEMCDAVHYAHQQLVIHRDLKPGNIYVTKEGRIKLLDFGIAKVLEADADGGKEATQTGLWFTPAYASPEQVRGEQVTTHSDVYSLGVLLYEMLTSAMPYDVSSSSPAQIVWAVCEQEPARPSTMMESSRVARIVSGDLDTIVLKALEKDPKRRYASVRELANDVRRYLAREPLSARPASVPYRLSKFVSRHRIAVTAAVLIFGTVLVGAVIASWQARVAGRERDRAEEALRQSENVSEFLIGLFEASDVAQNTEAAREMLRHGKERAEALSDDPVAQAQMLHAVGRAYHNLQEYNEAGLLLSRAFAIRDSLYPEGHPDLARTGYRLAETLGRLMLNDSAYRVLQNAAEMASTQFGDRDPLIADVHLELARHAMSQRMYDRAEEHVLDGLEQIRRSRGDSSPELVTPYRMLAQLAVRRRDNDSADNYFSQAVEHLANTAGRNDPNVGTEMLHYGDFLYEHMGDTTRAIQLFRDALALQERALGPEHLLLIHGLNSLAVALADGGQAEEALALVGRGLRIHRSLFGDHHIGTAREREQYAGVLRRLGRYEEAAPIYRDVIRVKRDILGDSPVATTLLSLSTTLQELGRFAEAERAALEGWAIHDSLYEGHAPVLVADAAFLGRMYLRMGDSRRAEQWFLDAERRAADFPESQRWMADVYPALADLYQQRGQPNEAARYEVKAAALGN